MYSTGRGPSERVVVLSGLDPSEVGERGENIAVSLTLESVVLLQTKTSLPHYIIG